MGKCVKCGNVVDHSEVVDQFKDVLAQADALGVDSLTENQQLLYEDKVCVDCYLDLQ